MSPDNRNTPRLGSNVAASLRADAHRLSGTQSCRAMKRDDEAAQGPEHVKLATTEVPVPSPLGDLESCQPRTEHEKATEHRRLKHEDPQHQPENYRRFNDQRSINEKGRGLQASRLEKPEHGILESKLSDNMRNKK